MSGETHTSSEQDTALGINNDALCTKNSIDLPVLVRTDTEKHHLFHNMQNHDLNSYLIFKSTLLR